MKKENIDSQLEDEFGLKPPVHPQEDLKPTVETPVEKPHEAQDIKPTVLLSQTDSFIHERMKAQPRTISEIESIKVEGSIDPSQHRLSLPSELKQYEPRFSFRWIYKSSRAVAQACDLKGWVLLNRSHFPDLPNHLFTVNGSIERGDNILAFVTRQKAEYLRQKPGIESRQRLMATFDKHKDNPNFYTPKDEESEEVIGI